MIEIENLVLFGSAGQIRLEIPKLKFQSPGISALVGHNGAGKSSLLRVSAGLEKPNKGTATFLGKNTFLTYESLKEEIHLLSWGAELFHSLTALDHLNLFRSLAKRWDTGLEQQLLQDLFIPLNKKVSQLSRGEQVKLRLLLSIPRTPKVILIDEVTNDLDTDSRKTIYKKLDAYSYETSAQVVVATNMVEDIERYATDIILLQKGRIILHNNLDAIKEEHKTSFIDILKYYELKGETI